MTNHSFELDNRYEILKRIGRGGMADVYKAMDKKLNRYVAIKVLKKEFSEDDKFVKRFKSEARSAACLSNPNIVNIYDVVEKRGINYIVMELIDGITLKDYIDKRGKLSVKESISISIQVAMGIDAAHKNHIIHRDIKPQNIMISKEGKVKVTDFGIARAVSSHTVSSVQMGSVYYIAPECARGEFGDVRSDIYSLGINMYEMITGKVPFDGDSTVAVAIKHLHEEIVPPSKYVMDIPYSYEQIILKCIQKTPEKRYLNIDELIKDLKMSLVNPDGNFVKINNIDITKTDVIKFKYNRYINDTINKKNQYNQKNEGNKTKIKRLTKIMIIFISLLILFIVLFIIGNMHGIFTYFDFPVHVEENKKIEVPNIIGMNYDDAKDKLNNLGVGIKQVEIKTSNNYNEGEIIDQNPSCGNFIDKNTTIKVVVSSGKIIDLDNTKDIKIPDIIGMSQDNAKLVLVNAGLKVGNISYNYSTNDNKYKVIYQNPNSGSIVKANTAVSFVVSEGDIPISQQQWHCKKNIVLKSVPKGTITVKLIQNSSTITIESNKINNKKQYLFDYYGFPGENTGIVEIVDDDNYNILARQQVVFKRVK